MIELRLLAVVCVGVALPSSEGSFFGLSMLAIGIWGCSHRVLELELVVRCAVVVGIFPALFTNVFDHQTVAPLVLFVVVMSAALRTDVTVRSRVYQSTSRSDRLNWTRGNAISCEEER